MRYHFPASALVLLALMSLPATAAVLRVDSHAPGPAHIGDSWQTAFLTPQEAVSFAAPGDEVWVAEGRYEGGVLSEIPISLYGGFQGGETERSQRNPAAHPTILEGADGISGAAFTQDEGASVLDGFAIRGSGTNHPAVWVSGGSAAITNNCSLTDGMAPITCIATASTYKAQISVSPPAYAIIRVASWGSDNQDGSSWRLAKRTIQAAVDAIPPRAGGEVWVAAGQYAEAIVVPAYASAYGGFCGTETAREQRNWARNRTVVCGGGASPLVTLLAGSPCATEFDGFVVQDDGGSTAGIYSLGDAVICHNTISRCKTGIECLDGSPSVRNNVIIDNVCGVYSRDSSARIVNNTIAGNGEEYYGGGIMLYRATPQIANNVIAYNAQGIVAQESTIHAGFRNNCLYANRAGDCIGIPNPIGSDGNIGVDPLPACLAGGNVHIQPASPCRNAGDSSVVPAGDRDIDGEPRLQGGCVDIGADEGGSRVWSSALPIIRVAPFGNDGHDGRTWRTAKRTIKGAFEEAKRLSCAEIWVAAGTYTGTYLLPPYVYLYGGFRGFETRRTQRDIQANVTVLDGARKGPVVESRLGYRISTLDGFTVRNGAVRTGAFAGQVVCTGGSPIIANNTISCDVGACILSVAGSPLIRGNRLSNSALLTNATGVSLKSRSATVDGNTITHCYGAGVLITPVMCDPGHWRITNNVFDSIHGYAVGVGATKGPIMISGNTITRSGQAIDSWTDDCTIANNIIFRNKTGITWASQKNPPANNCFFGNTRDVNHLPSPVGMNGNIAADPRFVSLETGDVHLRPDSPCRDAGKDSVVEPGETDADGRPRLFGRHVDIGAYEFGRWLTRGAMGG